MYNEQIDAAILKEREHLQQMRVSILGAENVDVFISLKHILDTIDDIATRIGTLHQYTSYDRKLRRKKIHPLDPEDFISHQEMSPKLLIDNLSLRSKLFRHSLRITLAAFTAFLIARLLPIGHSYWILLTVVVILKPGYSLTKKRNYERLSGTLIGAAICGIVLYFVKDNTAILILLALGMVGAYSFIRTNYRISVTLITFYVLLMFHLLDAREFKEIFIDRITDTAIGSVLAFIFSFLLSPIWEHQRINQFISRIIEDNKKYYELIAGMFTGKKASIAEIRVARKNSLVSLANLSDAFNQMLSEPKSKQRNIQHIHQLVVSNHMLVSHIATLSNYSTGLHPEFIMDDYEPLIILTRRYLERGIQLIENKDEVMDNIGPDQLHVRLLDKRINTLMHLRQEELNRGTIESETRRILSQFKSITDQFYFIYKVSMDIEKIGGKINAII